MVEDSGSNDAADVSASATTAEQLARLRALLVGAEQERLQELQERLDDLERRTEDVSSVLPAAVRASVARDDKLARALAPTIEESFQVSVRRDPRGLVEAIAPIMGPAIRKAIMQAIQGMVQSLNHAMEQSVSPQGLKWRVEAMRTGKPFAEVVLLHTLVYRVEQVFLIHRETGLLLQHVHAAEVQGTDADMVSGMLTAIQDFVHDSFGGSDDGLLHTMQVGERMVWVEQGSEAVLACVIRGSAHESLRVVLQEALENIQTEQRQALTSFSGETADFEIVQPTLQECLQAQYHSKTDKTDKTESTERSRKGTIAGFVAAAALLALLVWGGMRWQEARRWQGFVERVAAVPGIVVVRAERQDGVWHLSGMRDPLAPDPSAWLRDAELATEDVSFQWEPYQSFVPEYCLVRARQILAPPASVDLDLRMGVLHASGSAPHAWLVTATRAVALPGVTAIDLSEVTDSDALQMARLKTEIETLAVLFGAGSADLGAEARATVRHAATSILRLLALGSVIGQPSRIDVVGTTDASGSPEINRRLSRARAAAVLQRLSDLGVSPAALRARSDMALDSEPRDAGRNRRVSFHVLSAD